MKKQLHILLADDDQDDRFFFKKALKQIPLPTHLTTIENGRKLLDFLSKNPARVPDVLFLDINMPLKNGHECLTEIKNNPSLKDIPIVIYSTSLHDEVTNLFYKKGAHYCLKKCDFNELPEKIHQTLSQLIKNPKQPSRNKFIIGLDRV
jgi:CheY-like chemotaxis protein